VENQQLLKWYHRLNVPMICFILLTLRIILMGSGIGEAVALLGAAGLYAYHQYLNKHNSTLLLQLIKQVSDVKLKVESLTNKKEFEKKVEDDNRRKW
jgi:hypothetical protein